MGLNVSHRYTQMGLSSNRRHQREARAIHRRAEREGFEPSSRETRLRDFQSRSLDRSDTSPEAAMVPHCGRVLLY